MHPLAPVERRIHVQERQQGRRLQHLLALRTSPGGDVQPLRVEGGELLCPAVFAECPHIRAEGLQALLCKTVPVGVIHDVLQVLFGQAGNTLLAHRREDTSAPAALDIAAVARTGGLFE